MDRQRVSVSSRQPRVRSGFGRTFNFIPGTNFMGNARALPTELSNDPWQVVPRNSAGALQLSPTPRYVPCCSIRARQAHTGVS